MAITLNAFVMQLSADYMSFYRPGAETLEALRYPLGATGPDTIAEGENRLITINYPGSGNFTSFTYDGFGRRVNIVETTAGSVSSTRQFVLGQGGRCGARNSSGTTVLNQFFKWGEVINGSNYVFTYDHLGSIRELSSISGSTQAEYVYDPYGRTMNVVSAVFSDFQYGSYYNHSRSGLGLTQSRAYNANLGRWLSRDPSDTEDNLLAYTANPISSVDPSGLKPVAPYDGFYQLLNTLLPIMWAKCNCGCIGKDPDRIAQCKRDAVNVDRALVDAWVANFNMLALNPWGDAIGGLNCGQWADKLNDAITSAQSSIWYGNTQISKLHDSSGNVVVSRTEKHRTTLL